MKRLQFALCFMLLAPSPVLANDARNLLESIGDAYEAQRSYHDRGTIEITGDSQRLRFETVSEGNTFRLWIGATDGSRHRILWRNGDGVFLFDRDQAEYQPMRSLPGGIVRLFGSSSLDALVVPVLLAGRRAALEDYEEAVIEGQEPCGETTCVVVRLVWLGGASATWLWIGEEDHLVRRAEVQARPADGRWDAAVERRGIVVEHEILALNDELPPDLAAFVPPTNAQLVDKIGAAQANSTAAPTADADAVDDPGVPIFSDEISVELATVAVRVVGRGGEHRRDLGPEDFRVTAAKAEIPVVAVDWVSSDPEERERQREELARLGVQLPPVERHVVFFVQAATNEARVRGHMMTLPHAKAVANTLNANDWAAVVSFDSRLRLQLDFTRYHDDVGPALERSILFGKEPDRRGQRPRELSEHLDPRAARDAATTEQGLTVLAEALGGIPGEKDLFFIGWGVTDGPATDRAFQALVASRTTVFTLDVTYADYHTLEEGLRNMANATGGVYERAYPFPAGASQRLARTLAGHYILTLDRSALPPERTRLRIRLRDGGGHVLTAPISAGNPSRKP